MHNAPVAYRVEWTDAETGHKRYKRYEDVYKALKAERWAISHGFQNVYLIALMECDTDIAEETPKDVAKKLKLV